MTNPNEPIRVPSSVGPAGAGGTLNDGRGIITRDSKLGLLTAALVTAGGQVVVEWLGELDFSNAPRLVASVAPIVVGLASGWITAKMARRR